MIIYLIGFPGSGKLTIAKELCNIIDGVIVDNNLLIISYLILLISETLRLQVKYGKKFL
ncbi:UNVERIFIED_CONTAM: hypothetical protein LBW93_02045 [Wolbachia endosymbiont of Nasonia longicornis]